MSDEKREPESILRAVEKALRVVSDLCTGKCKWVMSIPVNLEDPDVVIGGALIDAREALIAEKNTRERLQHELAAARLIAAAPDHALLLRLMCEGKLRYFVAGIADSSAFMVSTTGRMYGTTPDAQGCPRLTDELRKAIQEAGAGMSDIKLTGQREIELESENASLKAAVARLKAELSVRTFAPGFPSVPAQYRGHGLRQAFNSGFDTGWRAGEFTNPYTSLRHQRAYAAGFTEGSRQAMDEIQLALKEAGL